MSSGDFGMELIKHIETNLHFHTTVSNFQTIDTNSHLEKLPEATIYTLATSTYTSNLYKSIDYHIYQRGGHWIPIVYDHPYLRVGPIFNPQKGMCYYCFEQQLQSNTNLTNYLKAMYSYYDSHPVSGPNGFLPPFLGWTRAMYSYILHQFLEVEGYQLGTYYQLNVTNQHITKELFQASQPCQHYN